MDELRKDLQISRLFDYYGDLLTDKQKNFIDLYYNEDFSLAEISEQENITRQGVRDGIKHAEQKLYEFEDKLRLAEKSEIYYGLCSQLTRLAGELRTSLTYSKQTAMDKAYEIEQLIKKYSELF